MYSNSSLYTHCVYNGIIALPWFSLSGVQLENRCITIVVLLTEHEEYLGSH